MPTSRDRIRVIMFSLLSLLYLAGAALSAYIMIFTMTGDAKVCSLFASDCLYVVQSEYGQIAGFPLSSLSLAYFVFQLSLLYKQTIGGSPSPYRVIFFFNLLAAVGSCFYLFIMFVVLQERCPVCIGIHVINFTCLFAALILFRKDVVNARYADAKRVWFPQVGNVGFALCFALLFFLGANLIETTIKLHQVEREIDNNLEYSLFIYSQEKQHVFTLNQGDQIYGNREVATHQIVLVYRDGCVFCDKAKEKLITLTKEYNTAVYLILKNQQDMQQKYLQKIGVDHVPAIFINGRRAVGWELAGFMKKFTEDCGC